MALINKLNAIGDAIRAKNGATEKYSLDGMVAAIGAIETGGGGGEYFTDADLTFTGRCDYLFAYDKWLPVLEKDKSKIKIVNPTNLSGIIKGCTGKDYSFLVIEGDGKTACVGGALVDDLVNIEKFPVFRNVVLNSNQSSGFVSNMPNFTDVNEIIKLFDSITFNNSTIQTLNLFYSCYSLRNIDAVMPYVSKAFANYSSGIGYNSCFSSCYALDEINNIPILKGAKTYNGFSSAFNSLARAKNITFETDNGTPIEAQWKGQTIDLTWSEGVGSAAYYSSYILNYNSGITKDKEVKDDATYQALKNDADWYATNSAYSRYNHDSAVNTINSLPDTSAYLAANGGTNTIKFKGAAGRLTDGGAINTLTDAEIAVAAAKGWTVSLT